MSPGLAPACTAANDRRQADAANRDVPLARQIMATPHVWAQLAAPYRRVVEARASRPAATWAQVGASAHMTKDAAYAYWRRIRGRFPELAANW